jgi:hypothetical protein
MRPTGPSTSTRSAPTWRPEAGTLRSLASTSLLLLAMALTAVGATPASVRQHPRDAATQTVAGRLVLEAREAPGLRSRVARPGLARSVLRDALLPGRLPSFPALETQVSHFARAGTELWSIAFVLGTPAAAQAALAMTARAARGTSRRAKPVPVGSKGYVFGKPMAGRPVVVLWRRGPLLGAIVLARRPQPQAPVGAALAYARLVDSRFEPALSQTAWERTLSRIGPKGQISRKTAFDLFALAYAPLPGTKRPLGPVGTIESGTFVARNILRLWPTLTAAQQAVALRLLGLTSVRPTVRRASGRAPAGANGLRDYGDPTFTPDASTQQPAEKFAQIYQQKLGKPLNLTIVAGETQDVQPTELADAMPIDGQGNYSATPTHCRVRITPAGQQAPADERLKIIAHEVFHCMQFSIVGATSWTAPKFADWVGQGTAEWAALKVTGLAWEKAVWPQVYLQSCTTPLYSRVTDSVGFFGHADDIGDLWSRLALVVSAGFSGGSDPAFGAAWGDDDAFLDSWGSSIFARPGLGFAWTMSSPLKAPNGAGCTPIPIDDDAPIGADPVSTVPYAILAVYPKRPLLHIEVFKGHARLTDKSFDGVVHDDWFCLLQSCECPEGTEGNPPPAPALNIPADLGLTGGRGLALGQVSFVSVDEFCKLKQPVIVPVPTGGSPVSCSSGCGSSNGDPHLQTFDFVAYDFMATGEFTLVEAKSRDLEVQVRQQPYPGSRVVSVTTGVAMRVAGDRVVVFKGSPLQLRVNGRPALVTRRALHLPHGGSVRIVPADFKGLPGQLELAWPDGTIVRTWSAGDEGLTVLVRPASGRAGQLRGLLGNFDGKPTNDFVTTNGVRLDPAVIRRGTGGAQYRVLYRSFGESWRVSRARSLFDYAPGQSTASFTSRGFPEPIPPVKTASKADLDHAKAVCRRLGIKDPAILAGCIVDVALTRDVGFAIAAARLQRTAQRAKAAEPAKPKPQPTKPPAKTTPTATLSFQGRTLTFRGSASDDGCGPFGNDIRFRIVIGTLETADNRPAFIVAVANGTRDGTYVQGVAALFEAQAGGQKGLVGIENLTVTLSGNRTRGTFRGTASTPGREPVSGSFTC